MEAVHHFLCRGQECLQGHVQFIQCTRQKKWSTEIHEEPHRISGPTKKTWWSGGGEEVNVTSP